MNARTVHPFTARTRIVHASSGRLLERLCAGLDERMRLERSADRATVEGWFGRVELSVDASGALLVRGVSPGEDTLSVLRMFVAERIHAVAGEDAPSFVWEGHGAGSTALPYFREMRVARAFQVTPLMRRVVLAGDAAHFAGPGLHVRVLMPRPGRAPVWPHAAPDGRTVWPSGEDALVARVYTVREVDQARAEVAIDVVLHEGTSTPGADWARGVRPGDLVGLLGPGGAGLPPSSWHLIAGDETALPAIARMVAALPAEAQAVVRIEVAGEVERQPLPSPARLDVEWLHRDGAAPGTTALLEEAVRRVGRPPVDPEACHVWAGCEQRAARALRAYATGALGIRKSRCAIAAYWRLGHEGVDVGE
ncbi:siderophore-interacting protein [Ancylobacter sp. MQZ15Z-1]|uniref:Siderophore-interacting protein n=1 Tax=Ancylobacter mangrovi TaxID=2972472 RepID=A0A9X2PCT4_9HYPH|nr:siderophore-interacting protein [Ancylobacter mangrovi]MCS0494536.1 siderophore-interacting protein [Ancylobacter mangrovi]